MNEHKAPSIEAARKMGEDGGPAVEEERLAFEAWMSGHCWVLGATWHAGKGYVGQEEIFGLQISQQARETRRLWAAWRDRAALARMAVRGDDAATSLDLDDVAATSETAKRELSSLRGLLVASHRRRERLETALRLAADEPNIDRARAIADAALAPESISDTLHDCAHKDTGKVRAAVAYGKREAAE